MIASLGGWMLSMRSTMISVLGEDYIRFARVRGLHPRRVMLHYTAGMHSSPTSPGSAWPWDLYQRSLADRDGFWLTGQGFCLDESEPKTIR